MWNRTLQQADDYEASEERGVCAHVRAFFGGHRVRGRVWPIGPMRKLSPGFHVLEAAPGPKLALWSYVSAGGIEVSPEGATKLEFMVLAPAKQDRHVELVTMAAHYHYTERLGFGHTLSIGEPWLAGSRCNCFLVSKPYPLGPELEIIEQPGIYGHVSWLLPITQAEREFANLEGVEALEQRFDEVGLRFWAPRCRSAV